MKKVLGFTGIFTSSFFISCGSGSVADIDSNDDTLRYLQDENYYAGLIDSAVSACQGNAECKANGGGKIPSSSNSEISSSAESSSSQKSSSSVSSSSAESSSSQKSSSYVSSSSAESSSSELEKISLTKENLPLSAGTYSLAENQCENPVALQCGGSCTILVNDKEVWNKSDYTYSQVESSLFPAGATIVIIGNVQTFKCAW